MDQGGCLITLIWLICTDLEKNQMNALDGFDDYMAAIMQKWHVPGTAVAVVQDDAVIYQKGFGLRDVEQNLPVTQDTVFAIGSSTKAFTGMSLGILVDDGALIGINRFATICPILNSWTNSRPSV
jgi:CubicO group peptidase (beta-lactamase class C family)